MNMAPPPDTRRTTSMPWRSAPCGSTSLRTDWNEPITTAGSSQSHSRRVGLRRPSPTSRASTSSNARFSRVGRTCGAMTSHAWSAQPVALLRARRTAIATARASKPKSTASAGRAVSMAATISSGAADSGSPFSAALMSPRASSGSRKKSPLIETSASCPAATDRSATTNLPPTTLYSPCLRVLVIGSPGGSGTAGSSSG